MNDDVLSNAVAQMQKAVDSLQGDLDSVRSGFSPSLLDKLNFRYRGELAPIRPVVDLSVVGDTVTIVPTDGAMLSAIEDALRTYFTTATIGDDGQAITVKFPPPSDDVKKSQTRTYTEFGSDAQVKIRNIRRDALAKLNKGSDDDLTIGRQLDQAARRFSDQINDLVQQKQDAPDPA